MVLVVKHKVGYITLHHIISVLQQPLVSIRHAQVSLATHVSALLLVVLRPDEVLIKHESLSMATMTMFCEREKVEVLNINQENDKSTQAPFIVSLRMNGDRRTTSCPELLLGLWRLEPLS